MGGFYYFIRISWGKYLEIASAVQDWGDLKPMIRIPLLATVSVDETLFAVTVDGNNSDVFNCDRCSTKNVNN